MALNPQNLMNRWSSLSMQPVARQLALLLGLAASIALGIGLVQWSLKGEMSPLYGEMSPGSTSEVIRSLQTAGIEYEFNNRTGLVLVPVDKVYEARLKLAGEGLPASDGAGFDMLYKEQEMGVSSFMEKARYDRALEQELAQSIASLDSVRSARVHLAMPKQSAFVRKRNSPAASVLLSLYGGRELTESQLAGVVHLVASSVPGLGAGQVSVVDNQGRLLSSQKSQNGFAQSTEQMGYTRLLEQDYADRIVEILTPILGVGAVKAKVAAEIDFTIVEKTSESYSPESSVRSEQLVEELSQNAKPNGGVPGTLSNAPPRETVVAGVAPESEINNNSLLDRSVKRETRNFEMDKTISHIREAPSVLKRLSVAVVLDYASKTNDGGELERMPLEASQLAEITALVKEAVGFDETRGDSVNVVNASFIAPPVLEAMPEPSLMEQEWVWRIAKLSMGGIAVLLVIFTVVRPLMQVSAAPLPSVVLPTGMPQGMHPDQGQSLGEDQVTLGSQQQLGLPGGAPNYQQQLNMARTMVENEPERVAHVVKKWVATDG